QRRRRLRTTFLAGWSNSMSSRCIGGAALALLISAAPAFAQSQSLGELARQEEARRVAAPKAKKTYSNTDLGPGAVPEPPAAVVADDKSCYVSKETGKCVSPEELVARSEAKVKVVQDAPTEAPVRREADAIRGELSRLQLEIDSLQVQAGNASLTASKRQAAADALAMNRQSLERVQRRWARLEKHVNEQKLPHDWIEPVPANATPQQ